MPDLAMELSHLELADKHIAQVRALIAEAIERDARKRGPEAAGAGGTLEAMTETLASFESHRDLILRTIADIRAGRL